MNTPASDADAKSGFERFFSSTDGQRYLCQKLEAVIRQRQEATPEPSSDDECLEEDHKWQCNILHGNFEPPEIDKVRAAIWQPDYGKIECQHYANALGQHPFHSKDDKATALEWRAAASVYEDFLRQNGLSADETRLIRQSIESQEYWELEKELLQQRVALREHEMHEAAQKKRMDIQRRRRELVRQCLQELGEELPPLPPLEQAVLPQSIVISRTTRGREPAKRVKTVRVTGAKSTNQRRRIVPHSNRADG